MRYPIINISKGSSHHRTSAVLVLVFAVCAVAYGQRYPATTSIQLIPPYSNNLEQYAIAGSDRLIANVVFNDFSQSTWNVKFRLTITSGSIQLQTSPDAVLPSVALIPGIPEQLTGFDLADYLSYNNMIVSGITLEDLARKGGLPDGYYTFSFEALDYRTAIPISNIASANAWLIQNDPPQVMFPACGERVPYSDPQNIPFQWLPMHLSSPNSSFTTEYEFTLVEMPDGINANEAILSGMPILSTTDNNTSFLYSATEPLLQNGKSYAFRVRATDTENLGLFKNEGYSQVCWFTYGYATNGSITTVRPADNALVNVNTVPVFAWNTPSNLATAQPVSYELRIFELPQGADPATVVLGNNTPVFEMTTPEAPGSAGFAQRVESELEPQREYVWQVRAFTSGIEIAASQPFRFSTTPVIQEFNAGPHIVRIVSISNQDLENFSGKARVRIQSEGTEAEFDFAGLKIISAAGKLVMGGGEIEVPVPEGLEDIELTPANPANGSAFFRATTLRVDKDEMSLYGVVEWALPFPVTSGQQAWVRSEAGRINFDNLKLNGFIKLDASNSYSLLDPIGFSLTLTAGSSNFFIRENQFTQNFDGEIALPGSVVGEDNAQVKIRFAQVQQMFINEVATLDKRLAPVRSTGIRVAPRRLVVDLSELGSPEKLSSDPGWKGVYFSEFDIEYLTDLGGRQLSLTNPIRHSFTQASNQQLTGWIDGEGLDLAFASSFETSGPDYATFNTFSGKLSIANINIEDGAVVNSQVRGSFLIPIFQNRYFDFVMGVSANGFEEAYPDEEVIEADIQLLAGKNEKVTIEFSRAQFVDHERLVMLASISWKGAYFPVLAPGFSIYGDGSIGFGSRGGNQKLYNIVHGTLNNFRSWTTAVGAGYFGGKYFIKIDAIVGISPDLSGPLGPTTISYYAYSEVGPQVASTIGSSMAKSGTTGAGLAEYNLGILSRKQEQDDEMLIDSCQVRMDVFLGRFEGYLKFTQNDPDWGDSWQGSFLFEMRIPLQVTAEAAYVAGRTEEGVDYWLLDVGLTGVGPDGKRDSKKNALSKAGGQIKGRIPKTKSFQQDASVAAAPPSSPNAAPQPQTAAPPAPETPPPSEPGGKGEPKSSSDGGANTSDQGATQGNLNLGPVSVTGFDFRIYRHMAHGTGGDVNAGASGLEMTFEPDASVDAGVYGRIAMVDGATGGGVFKMDMAFEYARLGTGKGTYGFEGNLDVTSGGGNFTGNGKLTYNEDEQHWLGDIWMVVAMPDKLCLEAGLAFDVSPRYWKLGIGSPERRVIITPKCQGWSPTGYFIIDAKEFELGVGIAWLGNVSSPSVNIVGNTFNVSVDLGIAAGAVVGIQYQPAFAFKKAGVWVEAWGAASVDYKTWLTEGTWVFASLKVAGRLNMTFEEQTKLEGVLSGDVELIGMSIDFQLPMNQTL